MNLLPLLSGSSEASQNAPGNTRPYGLHRRFARLLETARALFFPAGGNAAISSENGTLSGHEVLSKTPEESVSSPLPPTGNKPHWHRDRKRPWLASLASEAASVLSEVATASPPTISLPEPSASSSHSTALSEKTTTSVDGIGSVLIPQAETNANGSAQTSLPSLIEPDEPSLSERAPDETNPEILGVRVAVLRGSQRIEAEATSKTPALSDGARLTQATSAQTRPEVTSQQTEMQRPPAMTPGNALAPEQTRHSPAPVVPEFADHVSQQPDATPGSDHVPTGQFGRNGSGALSSNVDLNVGFGIRLVHLQTNQEATATALPGSRPASSMPSETVPQGEPAPEPRSLLFSTTEAAEPVNVSAQTPTEAEATSATAVRQQNHVAQKQTLSAFSPDGSQATGTSAQQSASNSTPQSSGVHSLAVSSEVSRAHPSEEATDRAEAATMPNHRPAKPATTPAQPSAPDPDASTVEADPALGQDFKTDPSSDVQLAAEEIDRPLHASTTTTPSPQTTALPRVIRTAAWFQMAMAFAERVRQHFDGQMLEVELTDGEGTLRVETRRHPDHVAVSVQLSDPRLRALVAAHADRIQEALQAQYQTAVQFSLSGGGEQGARQHQAFTQAPTHGTPLASGSDVSGTDSVESPPHRVPRPGSRHEWIG